MYVMSMAIREMINIESARSIFSGKKFQLALLLFCGFIDTKVRYTVDVLV